MFLEGKAQPLLSATTYGKDDYYYVSRLIGICKPMKLGVKFLFEGFL